MDHGDPVMLIMTSQSLLLTELDVSLEMWAYSCVCLVSRMCFVTRMDHEMYHPKKRMYSIEEREKKDINLSNAFDMAKPYFLFSLLQLFTV